ncbi:MAG: Ada metal-binding domain-containing protein [Planctomycetota bacterium]
MKLNQEVCYRALRSRDARFDGRFFTAVSTTGIYCRPICPARTPHRQNLTFYRTAAAAEAAGYRPCLRCRPESTPGAPDWMPECDMVSRALRRIQVGALDEGGVGELAATLGVGERHLSRLFRKHLGASPLAVARSRRAHFARKLIGETRLPMTRIAFSAGYGSVRRFNAEVLRTFGRSPTALRRRTKQGEESDPMLGLLLPYRPPFSWSGLLGFLRPRCIPGVEQIENGRYLRTFRIGDEAGWLEIRHREERNAVLLRVPPEHPALLFPISERVQRLLDLRADPGTISAHLPDLPVLRVPGAFDPFELAVRIVLGQQISVAAATTLAGRLVERFGDLCSFDRPAGLDRLFPAPELLARADLVQIGLPRTRAAAIAGLSTQVAAGELRLGPDSDPDQVRAQLRSLPGIGGWTAEFICMRALSFPDAFPASDLGLLKAAAPAGTKLTARQLEQQAERWRPFRAYAAMALWNQLPTNGVPSE